MLKNKLSIALIVCITTIQFGFAQLGFSHEIGIITGPVAFQSDFGERKDFDTNKGNTGFGIGLVHYINFAYRADCNCYSTDTYFNDHFKLRSEISYNKTKLNHFGEWVKDSRTSENARKLRGHSGESNNFDIGMQLEWFPLSIRSFQAFTPKFAPFASLGAHYVSYNPKAFTDYVSSNPFNPNDIGNIDDNNNFYDPWSQPGYKDPVSEDSGSTWSIVASVGTRYKINVLADLMIDLRWQYYFSDDVDGLNHDYKSNKNNDWLVWLNFGYIYYLD
ncbi:THC0290_0291 family protein [Aurantibacter aestuarii]|uniref:Glutamate dehydrogenase n=1 Tax=Aurantibacter aestuarii TaxID=1266046 RepID=A0A2T1NDN7_9FLAO|nr:glutamate dehydrogenase [Aurantibacter aestuarii]PSG90540.1 glutamate dehydrogenase [Aurantibacter aestuarii]